jgi:hypothetical protein
VALAGLVACTPPQPEPRTFFDFMDDGLAREGVLTRCNRNRGATLDDVECINARRAAAVVALEQDRERALEFGQESERKLIALRERAEREAQAAARAAVMAQAAARAAYEAQWRNGTTPATEPEGEQAASAPVFGAPVGSVLPSMSDSVFFEALAEAEVTPNSPTVDTAAAPPSASEIETAGPGRPLADLAIGPRVFRAADASH